MKTYLNQDDLDVARLLNALVDINILNTGDNSQGRDNFESLINHLEKNWNLSERVQLKDKLMKLARGIVK